MVDLDLEAKDSIQIQVFINNLFGPFVDKQVIDSIGTYLDHFQSEYNTYLLMSNALPVV